jgi:hypothetical protein
VICCGFPTAAVGDFQQHCWRFPHTVSLLLLFFSLLFFLNHYMGMDMQTGIECDDEGEDEAFLRRLIRPEEDRRRTTVPWSGGYRWFRSPNVVPLEQWRAKRQRRYIASPPKRMHRRHLKMYVQLRIYALQRSAPGWWLIRAPASDPLQPAAHVVEAIEKPATRCEGTRAVRVSRTSSRDLSFRLNLSPNGSFWLIQLVAVPRDRTI